MASDSADAPAEDSTPRDEAVEAGSRDAEVKRLRLDAEPSGAAGGPMTEGDADARKDAARGGTDAGSAAEGAA